jgi:hypothetical protein
MASPRLIAPYYNLVEERPVRVVEEKPVEVIEERPLDDGLSCILKTRSAAGLAQRPSAIAANRCITLEPQP